MGEGSSRRMKTSMRRVPAPTYREGEGTFFSGRMYTDEQIAMLKKIQRFWHGYMSGAAGKFRLLRAAMEKQRKQRLKSQIQEICIYMIFLALFTISSVLVVQDQQLFHFANQIRGQIAEQEFNSEDSIVFKDLGDVETIDEFYQWLRGPVWNTLYTTGTFDGGDERRHPGTLFGMDYIVGGVAISQLRVKPRECANTHGLKSLGEGMKCYGSEVKGEWSLATEDTSTFGEAGQRFSFEGTGEWGSSFWSVAEERAVSMDRRSDWQSTYPPGGFRVVLPNRNGTRAMEMIEAMMAGAYIDVQTRAVFFELTVFNPALEYWCHAFMIAEHKPSGGLLTTFQTDTLRLYTLIESTSTVTTVMEVMVSLFYVYYFVREMRRLCAEGFKTYFTSMANVVQNLNLFMYLLTWTFRLLMALNLPDSQQVVVDSDTFYPFHAGVAFKAIAIYCNSFNAFLCWFKLVKYLALLPNYALITGTMARSVAGVQGFSVVFLIVFYGFCAAFMMTFGSKVGGYRNMTQSAASLLRSLLGDFDFEELQRAQWFMGPFLFVLFVCVAVFVVFNALISIIGEAYEEERALLMTRKDVKLGKEIAEYLEETVHGLPIVGKWLRATEKRAKAALHHAKHLQRPKLFTPRTSLGPSPKPPSDSDNNSIFGGFRRKSRQSSTAGEAKHRRPHSMPVMASRSKDSRDLDQPELNPGFVSPSGAGVEVKISAPAAAAATRMDSSTPGRTVQETKSGGSWRTSADRLQGEL